MRGRVLAALLLSFLTTPLLRAQCSITPRYSAQFRTSVYDIAIDGNDLWAATGYGLARYDRSVDPPRLVSSTPLPGLTRVVRVANRVVYAGSGSTVFAGQRAIAVGGTVNDIAVTPIDLFVATSNGLVQIDLLDFHQTTLPTSSPNVMSLALSNTILYAADGDRSVEAFNIAVPSVPQKSFELTALPRSTAVHLDNGRVYVSDGIQTMIFTEGGTALSGPLPFGSAALAPLAGDAAFVAGSERRLHAVDFTTVQTPVEVFAQELPVAGKLNSIFALQRAGSRLYAAAGDNGLLDWDIASFAAPFALHAYSNTPASSVVTINNALYAGTGSGIDEYKVSSNAALTPARHWDNRPQAMRDATPAGFVLSSTGSTVIDWTVASTTPVPVGSVNFPTTVNAAALVGSNMYALLADRSIWTASVADAAPAATKVPIGSAKPQWLARSGSTLVAAESGGATTTLYLFDPGSDFTKPRTVTVNGVPTAGIAANTSKVAIFTYLGITLIDVTTGAQTVIPNSGSSVALPLQLAFAGNSLLEMTETDVVVWDTTTGTLTRRYTIPSAPVSIAGSGSDSTVPFAAVATSSGVATLLLNASGAQPRMFATANGNAYYKKVAIGGNRMLLFDGRVADVYEITNEPRFTASLRPSGLVDVAAAPGALFTLSSNSTVALYSPDGVLLGQRTITDGNDSVPLALNVVNGAPWLSLSKGCLSGGCAKETFVLDPRTLAPAAVLTGGVTDVTTDGNRAFAIFDMPSELRVLDVTNALQPATLQTRPADGTRPPVSLAEKSGTVYVVGDKLYTYDAASLTPGAQQLAFDADPTAAIRISSGCALVTARAFPTQLYALSGLAAEDTPGLPSPPQSIAARGDALFILTDHSLEVWSPSAPFVPPARRQATQR